MLLLHFVVGSQHLALPLSVVREVLLVPEMIRTPSCPSFVEGFFSLGGTVVPVIRLSAILQLPLRQLEPYDHILLLKGGHGLLVDEVKGLVSRDYGAVLSVPPPLSFNECVDECLRIGDRTVAVLSPERLLLEEEKLRVAEFGQLEQARLAEVRG